MKQTKSQSDGLRDLIYEIRAAYIGNEKDYLPLEKQITTYFKKKYKGYIKDRVLSKNTMWKIARNNHCTYPTLTMIVEKIHDEQMRRFDDLVF